MTHTRETFITKATAVHGDMYDYSEVEWIGARHKVKIGCPVHGVFEQRAYSHLSGCGCPQCSLEIKRSGASTFVEKAVAIHGTLYDYSKVVYVNSRTKVNLVCPVHGGFEQRPDTHLSGMGCPQCAVDRHRGNTASFVEKSVSLHGDRYDYSKVTYVSSNTNVTIHCSLHGDFMQTPAKHLSGSGCPRCATLAIADTNRATREQFIDKARARHGDTYTYTEVAYVSAHAKVKIGCPVHGVFEQSPNSHLCGRGCPTCATLADAARKRDDASTFITKAVNVHGSSYAYTEVAYVDSTTKVMILCPSHGVFAQSPHVHLRGHGCPQCALDSMGDDTATFTSKATEVHGNAYDYTEVEYIDSATKVKIRCPAHGVFMQAPASHISGQGCPSCGRKASAPERELQALIEGHGFEVQSRVRPAFLRGKELDLYVPDLKLAIEYCGSHVHNVDRNLLGGDPKPKTYHYDKWKLCHDNGITLLTVFDFMWKHKREQVEALIVHKLGINQTRIYARKCKVVDLDRASCWDFVRANHISGTGMWKHSCTYKGLVHNGEIVAVMVEQDGDIKRACVARGVSVVGGISKLYKAFPAGTQMVTTNDTGSSGNYGVRLVKTTLRYWWVNVNTLEYLSRNACMKHKLEARFGVPVDGQTEVEYMRARGYVRVFDSGLSYFVNA